MTKVRKQQQQQKQLLHYYIPGTLYQALRERFHLILIGSLQMDCVSPYFID